MDEKKRKEHNNDLIRRFKNGENILNYNATDTWFPPRKIIQKDKELVKKLYGDDAVIVGDNKDKKPHIALVNENSVQ